MRSRLGSAGGKPERQLCEKKPCIFLAARLLPSRDLTILGDGFLFLRCMYIG